MNTIPEAMANYFSSLGIIYKDLLSDIIEERILRNKNKVKLKFESKVLSLYAGDKFHIKK